jgi:hypothetical protein
MVYATVSQLKSALRLTDSIDDSMLTLAADSATELVNAYCGRTFGTAGTVTATRYYAARKTNHVEVDDMAAAPTFVEYASNRDGIYDVTVEAANYVTFPTNGLIDGLSWPFTAIQTINTVTWPISFTDEPVISVTAVWGFGSIPQSVVQAALLTGSRIFARLSSPLGVAGFGDVGVMRVQSKVDPDVEVLLQPYRRIRAAL